MVLLVAFAAGDGSQLVAEGGGGGEILANRGGIGPWETFRLFNRSRPDALPRHGDAVALQVHDGGFLTTTSSGGLTAAQDGIVAASVFTLERVEGAGVIASGDAVALRAADGRFVVAEGNGGGAVGANRPRRGPWETFTVTLMGQQLVRLRSSSAKYVTAEGGGGGAVTANRDAVGLWETFSLINFTRTGARCHPGDTVALRTWSGDYVRVAGHDGVDARANQARIEARFRLTAPGDRPIRHLQRVSLRPLHSAGFLAERSGTLHARGATAAGSALFTIELAEHAAIGFGWVPDGAALPGRPFDPLPSPVASPRAILTLHFFERAGEPVTTSAQIRRALTGPAPSLASWLRTMSADRFRIRDVGIHGPFLVPPVPAGAANPHRLGHDLLLGAAEASGIPLVERAVDGVIDGGRTAIVHIKAGGVGGQVHDGAASTPSGLRVQGRDAGVGVTTDVDEASGAVLCHEASHLVLDVRDRYGSRQPLRGDLIANRTFVGDWEPFVIERVGGAGTVTAGDVVTLRAHDGGYVSVSDAPPRVVNVEPERDGRARLFTVQRSSGGGAITHGAAIGLRSAGGTWMTAELGSDHVVTANRAAMSTWETFEVSKQGGTGPIRSGDSICLKSAAGLFVSAETGGRNAARSDADRQRGYVWGGSTGAGQGGSFDNADANYSTVMLSLYDRIRLGWVRPRYLTPDDRGCFVIRPFLDQRDALVLFDPKNPLDWYTVENRQFRADLDEVRSSGLVISWVREDRDYWQRWLDRANDPEDPGIGLHLCPAVVSAAAPTVPPNMLARPVVFDHASVTKRNDPGAAFTEGEIVLPLGNGDPSRFHLSFHAESAGHVSLCVL